MTISKRFEKFIDEGISLYEEGKVKEAVAKFKKAVEEDPESPIAYGNLGKLYRQEGKIDSAIKNFRQTLELDPTDVDAQFELGELLVEKEMYFDAVSHFATLRDAIEDEENVASINARIENILERGRIKLESGRLGEDMEELIEYGLYCLEQGMPNIAIDVFEKAAGILSKAEESGENNNTMAQVLYGIGRAYYNKSEDDKAIKYLEKAIALNITIPEPFIELSDILLEKSVAEKRGEGFATKELDESEKYLMAAIEKGIPGNAEIYDRLGDIASIRGDAAKARQYYEKCIEIEPEYASDYGIYEKLFNLGGQAS